MQKETLIFQRKILNKTLVMMSITLLYLLEQKSYARKPQFYY